MPKRSNPNNRRQGKAPKKTISGNQAISKMVRTGNNIANNVYGAVQKRYTGSQGMNNIARDLSMLKMLVNTEEKQVYTLENGSSATNANTSRVYGIGTMAQGTSSSTRVGDSVKITRIDLNLLFGYGSGTTTTSSSQTFNWYLIRYLKTPSTSGTTAFGIAEFLNTDGSGNFTPLSFPNPDTCDNFQLMANGQCVLDLPVQTLASSTTMYHTQTVSHVCNFHQEYSGSAATTITQNMVFVVITALNGANAGGASTTSIQSVMWYLDN